MKCWFQATYLNKFALDQIRKMSTAASQKPMDQALDQIRKQIDYLEFFIVQKVDREKKAQAKHLAHFFDGNEEFSFAVEACCSRFNTT